MESTNKNGRDGRRGSTCSRVDCDGDRIDESCNRSTQLGIKRERRAYRKS